jgi:hypothetical protein
MTKQKSSLKEIESNPTSFRPSDQLNAVLATLTPKQRAAIPRLVECDLSGQSKEALFSGENKICHRSVYFENWITNKVFVAALNLALAEARPAMIQSVVTDTVERLRQIAPLAANDLERQITGDAHALGMLSRVAQNSKRPVDERTAAVMSMGLIGTRNATDLLLLLIEDADPTVRKAAVEAIGKSATGLDTQRRMADVAVLDRAAPETASKAGESDEIDLEEIATKRWLQIAPLLQQLGAEDAATNTAAPVPG